MPAEPAATAPAPQPVASQPAGPASYGQIVDRCHGLDPAQAEDALFVTDQLRQEVTADQAAAHWCETLVARTESARSELAELRGQQAAATSEPATAQDNAAPATAQPAAQPASSRTGLAPVSDSLAEGTTCADPVAEWNAAIADQVKAGKPRNKAVAHVAKHHPELRAAMLEAVNSN